MYVYFPINVLKVTINQYVLFLQVQPTVCLLFVWNPAGIKGVTILKKRADWTPTNMYGSMSSTGEQSWPHPPTYKHFPTVTIVKYVPLVSHISPLKTHQIWTVLNNGLTSYICILILLLHTDVQNHMDN